MTDARGRALLGFAALAWLLPQATAEAWAAKSGALTAGVVALAAWSAWRGGRRELVLPAVGCACWGAVTVAWSLDPVRTMAGALAIGSLLLAAAGALAIAPRHAGLLVAAIAGIESVRAVLDQSGIARASGSFVNATHFGAAVALGAAAGLPALLTSGGNVRWVVAPAVLLLAYGVGRSGSRAGLIALGAGLAVAILTARRRPGFGRGGLALTIAVVFAGILLPSGFRDRLAAQAAGGEVSAWDRLAIWRTSAGIAVSHPWGVGLGAFGEAFNPRSPRPGVTTDYAHSEPVQVLVEAGWPGLLLAAWLAVAVRRSARIRDASGAAAISALAALGVFVLLDFPLHVPYLALAGVALVISLLPPPAPAPRVRPLTGVLAAATAASAIIWVAGLAVAEYSYARGYRLFRTNPPAAIRLWERAAAACPEYAPARLALAALRGESRR